MCATEPTMGVGAMPAGAGMRSMGPLAAPQAEAPPGAARAGAQGPYAVVPPAKQYGACITGPVRTFEVPTVEETEQLPTKELLKKLEPLATGACVLPGSQLPALRTSHVHSSSRSPRDTHAMTLSTPRQSQLEAAFTAQRAVPHLNTRLGSKTERISSAPKAAAGYAKSQSQPSSARTSCRPSLFRTQSGRSGSVQARIQEINAKGGGGALRPRPLSGRARPASADPRTNRVVLSTEEMQVQAAAQARKKAAEERQKVCHRCRYNLFLRYLVSQGALALRHGALALLHDE